MLRCWSCCEGDATDAGELDCGVWYDMGGYGGLGIAAAIMSDVSMKTRSAHLALKLIPSKLGGLASKTGQDLPADVYPLVAPGVL